MLTKNEIAEKLTTKGIALPANWGKLSTARAKAFLDIAETTKTEAKPSLMDNIGAPQESVHSGQTKTATMPKNPKWKRTTGGGRGWYPTRPAADPTPMTRQVRRQNERREEKNAHRGQPRTLAPDDGLREGW